MKEVAEEANRASSEGWVLVGFQVVESEACVVSLFQKQRPMAASSLVGE
jgi:hypothetical protein